jgi:hypothetical protein
MLYVARAHSQQANRTLEWYTSRPDTPLDDYVQGLDGNPPKRTLGAVRVTPTRNAAEGWMWRSVNGVFIADPRGADPAWETIYTTAGVAVRPRVGVEDLWSHVQQEN